MIRALAFIAAVFAAPAQAVTLNFCWLGAGGYSMTGSFSFPDALMARDMITERDVTAFQITGYNRLVPIGSWSLADRERGTTWHLRFDPQSMTFPTGGDFGSNASQGWNANGAVSNCGQRGFGFNSGNYSQDVCLFGTWVMQSAIDPRTPLVASTAPVTPACTGPQLLGKRQD